MKEFKIDRRLTDLLGSIFIIVAVYMVGKFVFDIALTFNKPPEVTLPELVRTAFVLLASLLAFRFLTKGKDRLAEVLTPVEISQTMSIAGFPFLGLSILSTLLFIISPGTFSDISDEDRLVENLSALSCFVGGIGLFLSTIRHLRQKPKPPLLFFLGSLLVSGIIILIGLEEVSWFQRIFQVETPSLFATNMQNEINLHNFKTDAFESAYYFLASIIFLALPILCWRYRKLFGGGVIRIFYPSMLLIPYGFVIVSCTYDMWNEPLTQYSFFTGCFIMIFLAVKLPDSSLFKGHILAAAIVGVTNFTTGSKGEK